MTANVKHSVERRLTKCTLPIGWLWSTCSSNRQSELSYPRKHTPTALPRFKNVIFGQNFVTLKNNRCTESEQRYLCSSLL